MSLPRTARQIATFFACTIGTSIAMAYVTPWIEPWAYPWIVVAALGTLVVLGEGGIFPFRNAGELSNQWVYLCALVALLNFARLAEHFVIVVDWYPTGHPSWIWAPLLFYLIYTFYTGLAQDAGTLK